MAGLRVVAENTAAVALSAATEKTAIQIIAPTNQRLKVTRVGIFFDGASTTAVPVRAKLITVSTAGTPGSALTLTKQDPGYAETIQATAGENYSAEGTNANLLDEWLIHPQMGLDLTYAFGQEKIVAGGARLAIKLTAPAVVNVLAKIEFEE